MSIDINDRLDIIEKKLEVFTQCFMDPYWVGFLEKYDKEDILGSQRMRAEKIRQSAEDPEFLLLDISVLRLNTRSTNWLRRAGAHRIIDLVNCTEDEVANIRNIGRGSVEEIKNGLRAVGLSLDMKIKETDVRRKRRELRDNKGVE